MPVVVLAAVLSLGSVESARGQAPVPEEAEATTPPTAEAVIGSALEELEAASAPDAEQPSEPELRGAELWARNLQELIAGLEALEKQPTDADAFYAGLMPVLRARQQQLREALKWARSPEALIEVSPHEAAPDTLPEEAVTSPEELAPTKEIGADTSVVETVSGAAVEGEDAAAPADEEASDVSEAEIPDEVQTLAALHDTVVALYQTRIVLLQYVTPELRAKVTGVGLTGVRELHGEILQLILNAHFKALSIPAQAAAWPAMVKEAPLPVVFGVVKLFVALVVFRWWRKWVPGALMNLRERLLAARPRRRRNLRFARFVWYLDRVRHPLEWLVLLWFLFDLVETPVQQELQKAPWTVIQWFLLAWFAVTLVNTFVARDTAGTSVKPARLRLASLRLVAAWLLLLGLGLDLAADYAGQGTIHAWVWLLFEVLALPLLVLMVILWRSRTFEALDVAPQVPAWVERRLEHRQGLKGFVGAAAGGLYLIGLGLQQSLFDVIAEMEWGRRALASLDVRGMARATEGRQQTGEPISAELRDRLIAGPEKPVEKIARGELAQLVKLVESGQGGQAVVIAERGGGKSTLLHRLASKFDGQVLIIDCPVEGHKAFFETFAKALKQDAAKASLQDFERRLTRSKIRAVALDNIHRLLRPMKGGLTEWDQVAELVDTIAGNIVWIVTLDQAAWQYAYQMRGGKLFLSHVLKLPSLTEEQLGDLIDASSTNAGIDPDFTKLIVPRQRDGSGQDTAAERSRLGFIRALWRASDGNPKVTLRLWAESLLIQEDGGIEVRLPEQPAALDLERLNVTGQLVLRVIAQCELASLEEIVQSLRLPEAEAQAAITALHLHGWIEELDGRYHISWPWWRTITRVLARKNLLPQSL